MATANDLFTLVEDKALKTLITGLFVSDENSAQRPVPVRFRLPEKEEERVTYPFMSIDLLDIKKATDGREHRGYVYIAPADASPGFPPALDEFKAFFPIPMELIYTVTTFARNVHHDRILNIQLRTLFLTDRFGFLFVPEDNTVRRLDFISWRQADVQLADGKRLFRKVYTIMVDAEIYPQQISALTTVRQLNFTQNVFNNSPVPGPVPAQGSSFNPATGGLTVVPI